MLHVAQKKGPFGLQEILNIHDDEMMMMRMTMTMTMAMVVVMMTDRQRLTALFRLLETEPYRSLPYLIDRPGCYKCFFLLYVGPGLYEFEGRRAGKDMKDGDQPSVKGFWCIDI